MTRCVVHDAHAPAHLALLVEEGGVLVAGDMLSDVELPMPSTDDTTLERYVSGLERLAESVGQARIVIPGHGTPSTDPMARFDADRRYLDDLISGRASDDPRIADPENASLHAPTSNGPGSRASGGELLEGAARRRPRDRAGPAGGRGSTPR